jgi:hypothetical protein
MCTNSAHVTFGACLRRHNSLVHFTHCNGNVQVADGTAPDGVTHANISHTELQGKNALTLIAGLPQITAFLDTSTGAVISKQFAAAAAAAPMRVPPAADSALFDIAGVFN